MKLSRLKFESDKVAYAAGKKKKKEEQGTVMKSTGEVEGTARQY